MLYDKDIREALFDFLEEKYGINVDREDIKFNVLGVNHFTWVDEARYKGEDLFPLLAEAIEKHPQGLNNADSNWANKSWRNNYLVLADLFKRYGIVAAAGDRHLAEFCPGNWYLKDPQTVYDWGFDLTTIQKRRAIAEAREGITQRLVSGEDKFTLKDTGEESVRQIKALLGLGEFITNVNLPNVGQMDNMPLGAVVETNAYFSGGSIRPIYAGALPGDVQALVSRVCYNQETVVEAALKGDYEMAFKAFVNDANVDLPLDKARELYDRMLYNTKDYLPAYEKYISSRK